MKDGRPLATRAQVAEYLGLPERTLVDWGYQNKGPNYTHVGRHVRYRWADVERWLREQRQGGAVPTAKVGAR